MATSLGKSYLCLCESYDYLTRKELVMLMLVRWLPYYERVIDVDVSHMATSLGKELVMMATSLRKSYLC